MDAGISKPEAARAGNPTGRSPAEVFRAVSDRPGVAFLDGRAGLARAPWSVLAWSPHRVLRIDADGAVHLDGGSSSSAEPLCLLDEFLNTESAAGRTVIGAIAYEFGRVIEPRSGIRPLASMPLVWLASYPDAYWYDHRNLRWTSPPPDVAPVPHRRCRVDGLRNLTSRERYTAAFERARAWIASGDVYQVNLSVGFEADLEGDPAEFYERLASRHPAPYGAYLDAGEFRLLSISPELFLAKRANRIATRPIKGTRPRASGPEEDAGLRDELLHDAKERAEHIMIVDLERNDLGRIAKVGSVQADDLWSVETYPTLHHLESTISAELRRGLRFSEILRATFPGGSITGAPKLRAMQVIDTLEDDPRGFYTGAVLLHRPDGDFSMNIAIRTATVANDRVRYRAGAGLVWDSSVSQEYEECLLKARAFIEATFSE